MASVARVDVEKFFVEMPHITFNASKSIDGDGAKIEIFDYIKDELLKDLTPKKFDEFLEKFPACDLQRIKGVFEIAAAENATDLLFHILDKKPQILNIADEAPCIVIAAKIDDAVTSLALVEKIIENKANVNLPASKGVTALAESTLKKTHAKVTRLLLVSGGLIYKQETKDRYENDKEVKQRKNIENALALKI